MRTWTSCRKTWEFLSRWGKLPPDLEVDVEILTTQETDRAVFWGGIEGAGGNLILVSWTI